MRAAIAAEYDAVLAEAVEAVNHDPASRRRTATRLARELRRIRDRDFFPPSQSDRAEHAVADLAAVGNAATEPMSRPT